MSWLMVSNDFDMSEKMANVMSLDLLSFALDMSYSKIFFPIGPRYPTGGESVQRTRVGSANDYRSDSE